jgi:hypothetical protein
MHDRQNNFKTIQSYGHVREEFYNYIEYTATKQISFTLVNKKSGQVKQVDIDYIHRWTQTYKNRLLAKMYKLEEWYKQDPELITFFTFTTKQRDFNKLEDQYAFLKLNFQKIRDWMRKTYKARTGDSTFNYFWVIEPHKSGFLHLHMMTFCTWTDSEKQHCHDMWCDKYEAGKREAQDIQDIPVMKVDYIRTYLFKYLVKNLFDENQHASHSTFNAVAWFMSRRDTDYTGIRFYGSSQYLTKIMKLDKEIDEDWICESVLIGDSKTYEWDEETKTLLKEELHSNTHGVNGNPLLSGFHSHSGDSH